MKGIESGEELAARRRQEAIDRAAALFGRLMAEPVMTVRWHRSQVTLFWWAWAAGFVSALSAIALGFFWWRFS